MKKPEPYSEAWLRNVLKLVVRESISYGRPWFSPRVAAKTFAAAFMVNASVGRASGLHCLEAIVNECSVGPVWLGASR